MRQTFFAIGLLITVAFGLGCTPGLFGQSDTAENNDTGNDWTPAHENLEVTVLDQDA